MVSRSYQCQKKRIRSNHRLVLLKIQTISLWNSALRTGKNSTLSCNLMKISLIILGISKAIMFMCMVLISLKAKKLKNCMFAQLWNSQPTKLLNVIIFIKRNTRTLKTISELPWEWLLEERLLHPFSLNS